MLFWLSWKGLATVEERDIARFRLFRTGPSRLERQLEGSGSWALNFFESPRSEWQFLHWEIVYQHRRRGRCDRCLVLAAALHPLFQGWLVKRSAV